MTNHERLIRSAAFSPPLEFAAFGRHREAPAAGVVTR